MNEKKAKKRILISETISKVIFHAANILPLHLKSNLNLDLSLKLRTIIPFQAKKKLSIHPILRVSKNIPLIKMCNMKIIFQALMTTVVNIQR